VKLLSEQLSKRLATRYPHPARLRGLTESTVDSCSDASTGFVEACPTLLGGVWHDLAPVPAFGKLINLCRRSKGLSVEQLAERARVDLSELINIEHDLRYRPEPRTVYQLSGVLDLPNEKLLQQSGNMVIRDMRFEQSAVKFAARSESVNKLSREEHRALEEFVKYLSEQK
jgi:HTH-type transcriptional regulator, competence development regulator